MIETTNDQLVGVLLSDENDSRRVGMESLKKSLERSRKDYISKKKELRQKQMELDELRPTVNQRYLNVPIANRRKGTDKRASPTEKTVPSQPAPSDRTGVSSALEKRLSGMERKLDQVLKVLEDLKREKSQ